MRLFVEVATRGSFAAVARDRNVDPSSISRAIAGLEAELGARLFQRTTRRMSTTEAGSLFLARVAPLVEELARVRDEIASTRADPVGTLRMTASVAFGHTCLVPLLPAFRNRFPRLRIELMLTDANLDLVADRVDLAIRLAPSYRADVVGTRLFATAYRVVASPEYLAREGPPSAPGELADRSCLLFALPEFRSRWLFRPKAAGDGTVEEVPVQGDIVLSSALALRSAALDGLGPVLLADWLIGPDLANGRLVDLFPEHRVAATTFDTAAWLLYPSRDYLPRKVRASIDFLRQHLRGPDAPASTA